MYKWDADSNPEEVAMYATAGASVAGPPDSPKHRNEFYLGLRPEEDDVALSLAHAASYPLREGVVLVNGSSVAMQEPLWPGTEMNGFLFLEPVRPHVPELEIPGGNHIVFLQATPVHPEEIAFKAAGGLNRLLDHWESNQVPQWDPRRGPAIPPA